MLGSRAELGFAENGWTSDFDARAIETTIKLASPRSIGVPAGPFGSISVVAPPVSPPVVNG
jgi:hypothetical protein